MIIKIKDAGRQTALTEVRIVKHLSRRRKPG